MTNDNGGINGKKIKLIDVDYAYKIDRGPSPLYKKLMNDDKVVMIHGWGTGDTRGAQGLRGPGQDPLLLGLLRRRRSPTRPRSPTTSSWPPATRTSCAPGSTG